MGGIGSEAYMAVKLGRKATLIELKPEYYEVAVKNLKQAENDKYKGTLFTLNPEPQTAVIKTPQAPPEIDCFSSWVNADGTPWVTPESKRT